MKKWLIPVALLVAVIVTPIGVNVYRSFRSHSANPKARQAQQASPKMHEVKIDFEK